MNKSLLLLSIFYLQNATCFSQWNSNPAINTAVCTSSYNQKNIDMISDGKGGAIIAWEDSRNDTLHPDIYVQRIDKNGYPKWTLNGIGACTQDSSQSAIAMVSDSLGGAIIFWEDGRGNTTAGKDIYAQRLDSSGNLLWAVNGIAVVAKPDKQMGISGISDNNHGAIITWEDTTQNDDWDIFAQRISGNGTVLWTTGGISICSDPSKQVGAKLVADGSGGAFIVWQDFRNTLDYDIYAQRIDASGNVQWTVDGTPVCTSPNTQKSAKIKSDNQGGAIMVWVDKRNGADYDIYTQRVNGSGVMQWTANGAVVCNMAGTQTSVDLTTTGVSGAIMAWADRRNGTIFPDIYAQRISLNGVAAWASNGIAISTAQYAQTKVDLSGDGSGGANMAWQDSSSGNWNIMSQKVNANGTQMWTTGGVSTGVASGSQISPKNIGDGSGGSIFAWQDKRGGVSFDVYAHHLFSNGSATGIDPLVVSELGFHVFPNPFTDQTTLSIDFPVQNGVLIINNCFGQTVAEISNIHGQTITVSRNNLSSGLYFIRLTTGSKVYTGKMLISVR